jgi:UDP-2-acetamido-2,6-beta-L-arabino-hexul-4-ose reductase
MSEATHLITGGHGFLGWHIACALHASGRSAARLGREPWAAPAGPAVLLHVAGVNRGTDDEVESGNIGLAHRMADLVATGDWEQVVYVNSVQSENDSPYGRSKRAAGEIIAEACTKQSIPYANVIVPNVFGEHGRPEYNSFVATFCHRIVQGIELSVTDREVELVHASDVADAVLLAEPGELRITGTHTTVAGVAELLKAQYDSYSAGLLPDMSSAFERTMFNTLRSFMFPARYPLTLDPRTDPRGTLVEAVKAGSGGQSFVSWTNPGFTRGNHYHRRKFERFLVLEGEAEIKLRRLFTDDVVTFRVSGANPGPIDMPCLHTHSITNVGDSKVLTMFWTNEVFDPANPDTYPEIVER